MRVISNFPPSPTPRPLLQAVARASSGASGGNWAPGSKRPAHLPGTAPGDNGFDPLGLAVDPKDLAWFTQAELIHARFAMAGAAGILIPSILTHAGVLDIAPWYEAGKVAVSADFQADGIPPPPIGIDPNLQSSGTDLGTLLTVQLELFAFVEIRRWMDIRKPGSLSKPDSFSPAGGFEKAFGGTDACGYPGGIFDPLGLSKNNLRVMQERELANGRLAMLSVLGFFGQYGATKTDPVQNWLDHVASPWTANVCTNATAVPVFNGGELLKNAYGAFNG